MANPLYVAVAIGIGITVTARASVFDTIKTKSSEAAQTIKNVSSQGAAKAKEMTSQAASKAQAALSDADKLITQAMLSKYRVPFPHQNETVRVRSSNVLSISDAERAFLKERNAIIRIGSQRLLGVPVTEQKLPTIGICMSGGGYRAMLMATASIAAFQKMGLLDASTYISALSGSTWSLFYWLASGKTMNGTLNTLVDTAGRDQILPAGEWKEIAELMLTKKAYGETVGIVDLYGAYLAAQVFSDVANQQDYVMSQLSERVASGQVPFPIGTAVSDNIIDNSSPYQWFEVDPFEFGSTYLNAWIPIWAVGRTFNQGVSTNAVPEQTLGFWFGVCGSAFSISIRDIIERSSMVSLDPKMKTVLLSIVRAVGSQAGFHSKVIDGGKIPNPAYGLSGAPIKSQSVKQLDLVDAGFAFNHPLPPLLRLERNLDIIILLDSNGAVAGRVDFKKARDYARANNLRFPVVSDADITAMVHEHATIFGNPSDPRDLVIVYIPTKNNESLPAPYNTFDAHSAANGGFADTTKFKYSRANAELLTGYYTQNMIAQKEKIKDIIAQRLKALNS